MPVDYFAGIPFEGRLGLRLLDGRRLMPRDFVSTSDPMY
jgi:hypothetical protein